jgi:hypothetical protein
MAQNNASIIFRPRARALDGAIVPDGTRHHSSSLLEILHEVSA